MTLKLELVDMMRACLYAKVRKCCADQAARQLPKEKSELRMCTQLAYSLYGTGVAGQDCGAERGHCYTPWRLRVGLSKPFTFQQPEQDTLCFALDFPA